MAFSTLVGFNYKKSVLTEIKNSGELKNIKKDSVRIKLIEFDPFIEEIQFQENSVNSKQKQMLEQISVNGDLRLVMQNAGYNSQLGIGKTEVKSKGNKFLFNDDYFKNEMIIYLSITSNLTDQLYPRMRNRFIDIVNKIDNEIDKMK